VNSLIEYPLQYWQAGGPLLLPLAPVCFGIWFYFLRTQRRILAQTKITTQLIQQQNAAENTTPRQSQLANLLRHITQPGSTPAQACQLFDDESAKITARLKHDMIILAALTAAAPLLGLLGTVTGMMQTFTAVANSSAGTSERVAAGVSRALITTQAGLVIAIPGVFGLARIKHISHHLQVKLSALKLHAILLPNSQ
jgi:biopolymer transport protein ExbB